MTEREWTQGNWNAWVVFEITKEESQKRCAEVPEQFREIATSHARTYWAIQERAQSKQK